MIKEHCLEEHKGKEHEEKNMEKGTEKKNEVPPSIPLAVKSYIVIGILVVLLLVSVTQAVQINTLQDRIDGQATTALNAPIGGARQPAASAPRAPVMVGGC